ncbi:VOC family protein [Aurantiacibacter gangjinensis]|uniref:Uncharacterized protein n=1 Tax=Aurantiacibacter gangjinensis TaxID=502682 RepID=A0A0G9MRU4_9SPHN|nr:hypothetical protein [Aurantiacibacter gangjinensis]APE28123.1 hypothetical protein BMF35_a1294 [Aurantiacibacter gangjinensis]KLE32043.1 hypothetical protein AAW01_11500 [Aurantiacibacter gangjinensis]
MTITHGTILGGLSTVPDLDAGLKAYHDVLGLSLVEQGQLDADLATSWGCPASAGSPYAVLQPESGEPCWFRLVEQPEHPDFRPTRTYGWAAFECTVQDVWRWPKELPAELFTIVGMPKNIENMQLTFIPMQALGPGREMVYLNEVLVPESDLFLPAARSDVDRIFICVLATPDREASLGWYIDALGLERGTDYTIPYTMINKAFDLPAGTQTTLTMLQKGKMPIIEVDDYPPAATVRPRYEGRLPPGNALVTLAVDDLDTCKAAWLSAPTAREGALYDGRRAVTTMGPAGELLELVETG